MTKSRIVVVSKLLTIVSLSFISFNMFFRSFEKGQLIIGLFTTMLLGTVLINDVFPQYLDSITERNFSISLSIFAASLYFCNTTIFMNCEQPYKNSIIVLMVISSILAGIGLSYPFRKLKHFLVKKELLDK